MTEPELRSHWPRYCIYRKMKCRVISYDGDGKWWVLDTHDERRLVARSEFRFIKGAK